MLSINGRQVGDQIACKHKQKGSEIIKPIAWQMAEDVRILTRGVLVGVTAPLEDATTNEPDSADFRSSSPSISLLYPVWCGRLDCRIGGSQTASVEFDIGHRVTVKIMLTNKGEASREQAMYRNGLGFSVPAYRTFHSDRPEVEWKVESVQVNLNEAFAQRQLESFKRVACVDVMPSVEHFDRMRSFCSNIVNYSNARLDVRLCKVNHISLPDVRKYGSSLLIFLVTSIVGSCSIFG